MPPSLYRGLEVRTVLHLPAPSVGSHPALTHGLQWVVLVAEFCSPILLWLKGRALYAALFSWAGFHLSTYVLLKIHFLPLVACLLSFLPLERLPHPATLRRAATARLRGASAAPSSGR